MKLNYTLLKENNFISKERIKNWYKHKKIEKPQISKKVVKTINKWIERETEKILEKLYNIYNYNDRERLLKRDAEKAIKQIEKGNTQDTAWIKALKNNLEDAKNRIQELKEKNKQNKSRLKTLRKENKTLRAKQY